MEREENKGTSSVSGSPLERTSKQAGVENSTDTAHGGGSPLAEALSSFLERPKIQKAVDNGGA